MSSYKNIADKIMSQFEQKPFDVFNVNLRNVIIICDKNSNIPIFVTLYAPDTVIMCRLN